MTLAAWPALSCSWFLSSLSEGRPDDDGSRFSGVAAGRCFQAFARAASGCSASPALPAPLEGGKSWLPSPLGSSLTGTLRREARLPDGA